MQNVYKQMKEKISEIEPQKIPEMFASIPSCAYISLWPLFSPYVISIDNSSFHKRIIKQTLIKICQLQQTIGDVFRDRINFVLLCKLRGV